MWHTPLTCDMTHSDYMWHTPLTCDMTHSDYMSHIWRVSFKCVDLWHTSFACDMTHSVDRETDRETVLDKCVYMWDRSFTCDMTHSDYMWHIWRVSFKCVAMCQTSTTWDKCNESHSNVYTCDTRRLHMTRLILITCDTYDESPSNVLICDISRLHVTWLILSIVRQTERQHTTHVFMCHRCRVLVQHTYTTQHVTTVLEAHIHDTARDKCVGRMRHVIMCDIICFYITCKIFCVSGSRKEDSTRSNTHDTVRSTPAPCVHVTWFVYTSRDSFTCDVTHSVYQDTDRKTAYMTHVFMSLIVSVRDTCRHLSSTHDIFVLHVCIWHMCSCVTYKFMCVFWSVTHDLQWVWGGFG